MGDSARKLVYEGSVKNLWSVGNGQLEFEYTDAYSVFDWGRMPDALAYKGESLAAMGAYFFKRLSDAASWRGLSQSKWVQGLEPRLRASVVSELETLSREGMKSHFIERSGAHGLLVKKVEVHRPQSYALGTQTLVHYSRGGHWEVPSRLVPLEVVFRFGMPKGSSLVERLTPAYARSLGLTGVPREGEKFTAPVLEFFTKLEDTDRFLTWEQALNYSGVEYTQFEQMVSRTLALAIWLASVFEEKGLELWDGKFEWALLDGKLALVDSIGPDELRLLAPQTGTQLSKEFLRLFYRDSKWFEAVKQAKKEAEANPDVDWQELVRARVGEPPRLSTAFREAADALYPSLALAVTGSENPGGRGLPMPQLLERIEKCLAH